MQKYRIAFLGGRRIGSKSLGILNEYRDRIDIAVVVPNKKDGEVESDWNPPIIPLAQKFGFPTYNPPSMKDRKVIDYLKEKEIDLILNVFCSRIVPKEVLDIPGLGAINIHFGKLPEYGGRFIVTHIILNGETSTCATAHYMEEEVDAGDIIFEEPVPVKQDDTARSLYFRCTDAATVLLRKVLDFIIEGKKLPRKRQAGTRRYFYFEEPNQCQVNLLWDKDKIERFIRAVTFEPVSKPWMKIGDRIFDITPRR
jgi:methionyl-tRNA formyltransferase